MYIEHGTHRLHHLLEAPKCVCLVLERVSVLIVPPERHEYLRDEFVLPLRVPLNVQITVDEQNSKEGGKVLRF